MRIEKLFTVLVVGGSVLSAGCGAEPGPVAAGRAVVAATADVPVADVAAADVAAADVAAADVASADTGAVDAGAADAHEAGVQAWLSWI